MQVTANVNYHVNSPDRQAYVIDAGGEKGRIVPPQQNRVGVSVRDLRGKENTVRFARDCVAFLQSSADVDEFGEDGVWKETYDSQLTDLLKREIGARDVVVFDHTVRIDDPNSGRKPARNVHSDYSEAGARQRLRDLLGEDRAVEWEDGHFGFVNVWRPIKRPITSAPLGFVLPRSVQPEDWILLDLIYPDRVGQIMGLVASTAHQWVYLSGMKPDEVAVFNIFDNQGLPSIAHSALDLASDSGASAPRMSIESRTLVRYQECGGKG